MITPAGHRVLIKEDPYVEHNETLRRAQQVGIILSEKETERDQHAVTRGTIIAIGHSAWRAYDGNWEGWKPWCKVGDKVDYSKFAGSNIIDPDN